MKGNNVIVGVMQPYFFPYIGYWQLLNAVDKYVIYDDVNYINRGWINRNRILCKNGVRYLNLPLFGASQNKLIKDIRVNNDEKEIERNLSIIKEGYKKAPYFPNIYPLLEDILYCHKSSISEYIYYSLKTICEFLGIETEMILSSEIEKNNDLKGQEKIIEICQILGASDYYNAIGGQELYDFQRFKEANLTLHFVKTHEIIYKQFDMNFESNLSIIDVMMFNSKENIKRMLLKYSLVD